MQEYNEKTFKKYDKNDMFIEYEKNVNFCSDQYIPDP